MHLVSDGNDESIMIINDQTQTFLDMFHFSADFATLTLHSSKIITDGTQIHDQRKSNLCVSYALTTALREALKQCAKTENRVLSNEIMNKRAGIYIPAYWSTSEVLDIAHLKDPFSKNSKIFNIASFSLMLQGYNNCVRYAFRISCKCIFDSLRMTVIKLLYYLSPRSLSGTNGSDLNQKEIKRQLSNLKKCAERLSCKSFFQEEGWKRILGVRRFFEAFDLDMNSFKLVVKEFIIPTCPILTSTVPDLPTISTNKAIKSNIWKTGPFNFICQLVDIHRGIFHAVAIYGMSDDKNFFKIKDSQGLKYQIPVSRCSYFQVKFNHYKR